MKYKYILFLKYAIFKNGTKEELFAMKQNEIDKSGKMYWGYGGYDVLPERDIRPLINLAKSKGEVVKVLFCQTKTFIKEDYIRGTELSTDNISFKKAPHRITLHGNKFAFVMKNLQKVDIDLNLLEYQVTNGNQKNKCMADVIKGYTNKATGILSNQETIFQKLVKITYQADLLDCLYVR